jgi:hypothetical protein
MTTRICTHHGGPLRLRNLGGSKEEWTLNPLLSTAFIIIAPFLVRRAAEFRDARRNLNEPHSGGVRPNRCI